MQQNKSKSNMQSERIYWLRPNKWTIKRKNGQSDGWTGGRSKELSQDDIECSNKKKNTRRCTQHTHSHALAQSEFNFWMRNVDVDAVHGVCDQHVVAHSFVYGIMVMLDHRLRNLVALDFDRCRSALAVGDPNEHVHGDGHGYKLIVLLLNRRRRYYSWVRSLRSPSRTYADRRSMRRSADPVNSNMFVSIVCPPRTWSSAAVYALQMCTHGPFRRQPATLPVYRSALTVHRPIEKRTSK